MVFVSIYRFFYKTASELRNTDKSSFKPFRFIRKEKDEVQIYQSEQTFYQGLS